MRRRASRAESPRVYGSPPGSCRRGVAAGMGGVGGPLSSGGRDGGQDAGHKRGRASRRVVRRDGERLGIARTGVRRRARIGARMAEETATVTAWDETACRLRRPWRSGAARRIRRGPKKMSPPSSSARRKRRRIEGVPFLASSGIREFEPGQRLRRQMTDVARHLFEDCG